MRPIILTIFFGFVFGAASCFLFLQVWQSEEPEVEAKNLESSLKGSSANEGLLAKIAELEKELKRERSLRGRLATPDQRNAASTKNEEEVDDKDATADKNQGLPDLETLFQLVDREDAPGLKKAILALLSQPKEGYSILFDFLYGEVHSPRQALFNSRPLMGGILSLGTQHSKKVAGFASYVLKLDEDLLDEKVSSFVKKSLPLFLAFNRRGLKPLRDDFVQFLYSDLVDHEDEAARLALEALTDLRAPLAQKDLSHRLKTTQNQAFFRSLLKHIEKLSLEGGLGALHNLILENKDGGWKAQLALNTLARLAPDVANDIVENTQAESIRDEYEFSRYGASLADAQEFLNSGADLDKKQRFLSKLTWIDPKLLEELKIDLETFGDSKVKELVSNTSTHSPTFLNPTMINLPQIRTINQNGNTVWSSNAARTYWGNIHTTLNAGDINKSRWVIDQVGGNVSTFYDSKHYIKVNPSLTDLAIELLEAPDQDGDGGGDVEVKTVISN